MPAADAPTDPTDVTVSEPAQVELVVVTPDDWSGHRALRLDMLQETPDAFCTAYEDVADLDEPAWRRRISQQRHLQARVEGEPVGTVGLWSDEGGPPRTTTLVAMYVAPAWRGRAVAARLVQAVLDDAAARGEARVRLEVTSNNDPARALYARMGFVDTGLRLPHPRRPELQELVMDHPLVGDGPGVEG